MVKDQSNRTDPENSELNSLPDYSDTTHTISSVVQHIAIRVR